MEQKEVNKNPLERLDIRLLGLSTNLESQAACDSASRSAMRSSFMTQMLVTEGSTPRRLVTLAEREYGKYTMHVVVPCDCKVLKVLRKYPKSRGMYSFKQNSETLIIYESLKDHTLGSIRVPTFYCNHKVFGFKYIENPLMKTLSPGDILMEGTILADSPSVKDKGDGDKDYQFGVETSLVFMSVPGIIEDGVVASKSFCEKMKTRGYGSKTVEWGTEAYPLNLYGTDDDYKVFPDIGNPVREDGILFATRDYDPLLAVCNMTKEALRTVNHTYDNITYIPLSSVDNAAPPVVEDIVVWHTHNPDLHRTPPQMEKQVRKYHDATKIYHTEIIDLYEAEAKRRKQHLNVTNDFHQTIVRAMVNDNNASKYQLNKSVIRTYRKSKLNDWRVEVKFGWDITPGIGYKVN